MITFVLENFTEMNKLWIRMQYLVPLNCKQRVDAERAELKILIASSLNKLCEMCNDDSLFYIEVNKLVKHFKIEQKVLNVITQDLIYSKDAFAEEFLFECILNIFPGSFHSNSMDKLILILCSLDSKVDFSKCYKLFCERIQSRILELKSSNQSDEAGYVLLNLLKTAEIFKSQVEFLIILLIIFRKVIKLQL